MRTRNAPALFLGGVLLCLGGRATAAEAGPKREYLWPDGAPGAVGDEEADRPSLTVYLPPAALRTGAAVVVCPGGGYGFLAVEHEGREVAEWLNSIGAAAFVLRYRIAPRYRHPAPLQDAQRAIRTVRARAGEWGVAPERIGILGFSAGGHLASAAGTHFDDGAKGAEDPIERASSRPDFLVLVYPVISFTAPWTHRGSRENLLGKDADPKLAEELSSEKRVTARTPPAFLVHTSGDRGVPAENSAAFYLALREAGVPAELHVYERGAHGFGLGKKDPVLSSWPERCREWLEVRGILPAARAKLAESVPGAVIAGTVRAADGVPIAFEARGKGETALVFVHGWACDRTFWRDQLDAFASNHRIVALDLPGHGASGARREEWSLDAFAADVEAVVAALELDRVVLVGHSMGGPVSLLAAPRLSGRVIGVVGVDALHNAEFRWPEETVKELAGAFERDFDRTMDDAVRALFPAGTEPALVRWVMAKAKAVDRRAAIALLGGFAGLELEGAFAAAKVPVRSINAAPRPEGGFETAIETNRKYADYDAVLLEGVGHYPMLERPAEFNARLREVLRTLDPERAGNGR